MNLKFLSILILGSVLVFGSCSLEKRVYTKGYHSSWKDGRKMAKEQLEEAETSNELDLDSPNSVDKESEKPLVKGGVLAIIASLLNVVLGIAVLATGSAILLWLGAWALALGAGLSALSNYNKEPDKYRGKQLIAALLFTTVVTPFLMLIYVVSLI